MNRKNKFFDYVIEKNSVRRVLIIRNGLVGDVVSITSVIKKLIDAYPGIKIDLIIGPTAGPVLENIPGINKVYKFNFTYNALGILRQIPFFIKIGFPKYDVVIVNEVNTHFTIMSRLVRSSFHIGFTNSLSGLYDYSVTRPYKEMTVAECETVREWTDRDTKISAHLVITKDEIATLKQKYFDVIDFDQGFVIIHPGTSSQNSERYWEESKYAELANALYGKYNFQAVLSGVTNDLPNIVRIADGINTPQFSSAGKTTLREMIILTKLARLVIAPDTGITHIAAALDTPVVALMGMNDPVDTGPYNSNGKATVACTKLACQPCVLQNPKPPQWEHCKNTRPVTCMQELTVEMVMEAVTRVLLIY